MKDTKVIAANDSSPQSKEQADLVCYGSNDQEILQLAMDSKAPKINLEVAAVSLLVHPVACAVINHDGKLLTCRRKSQHLEIDGWWEFPGGSVEYPETPYETLTREIREELALDIVPIKPLHMEIHQYPFKEHPTLLMFYICSLSSYPTQEIKLDGVSHYEYKWLTPIHIVTELENTLPGEKTAAEIVLRFFSDAREVLCYE